MFVLLLDLFLSVFLQQQSRFLHTNQNQTTNKKKARRLKQTDLRLLIHRGRLFYANTRRIDKFRNRLCDFFGGLEQKISSGRILSIMVRFFPLTFFKYVSNCWMSACSLAFSSFKSTNYGKNKQNMNASEENVDQRENVDELSSARCAIDLQRTHLQFVVATSHSWHSNSLLAQAILKSESEKTNTTNDRSINKIWTV